MSYHYISNISELDRFDQLEFRLDNGDIAVIKRGFRYNLSSTEVARAGRYVHLVLSGSPADAVPEVIAELPVLGGGIDGYVPVWSDEFAAFIMEPFTGGGGAGSGSLLFGQAEASLTSSLTWRAPASAHFSSGTVTVANAVTADVDIISVDINGVSMATLSLDNGTTTNTLAIDLDLVTGDRLGVTRLDVDGGAIQVQLDR